MNERTYETHPSYGMASFSRSTSGHGPRLFQSHTDNSTFISLKIKQAEVSHDLGRDWVHGRELVCEVSFSAAQFAELLTTMNIGDGVPCTIRRVEHKEFPYPPPVETLAAKVHNRFQQDVKDKMAGLQKLQQDVIDLMAKPTMKAADKKAIADAMHQMVGLFTANAPFMLRSFEEAVEKTVVGVKAEFDAFLTHSIQRAGIEHLQSQAPKLSMAEGVKTLEDKDWK
jgi:hypothetical protein